MIVFEVIVKYFVVKYQYKFVLSSFFITACVDSGFSENTTSQLSKSPCFIQAFKCLAVTVLPWVSTWIYSVVSLRGNCSSWCTLFHKVLMLRTKGQLYTLTPAHICTLQLHTVLLSEPQLWTLSHTSVIKSTCFAQVDKDTSVCGNEENKHICLHSLRRSFSIAWHD